MAPDKKCPGRKRERRKGEAPARSGWNPQEWADAAGIGRATYYKLPPSQQPHSVKVGTRRVIHEAPAAWLARMAALQGAAA